MKIKFTLLLLIVTMFGLSAQELKKGYIINTNKTVVYFKNPDFNDVSSIRYKLSETGDFQKLDQNSVVEFGIEDDIKIVKKKVSHDVLFGTITKNKDTKMETEDLYLTVLSEGDINLYSYVQLGVSKFFYETDKPSSKPIQLIHKKYQLSKNSSVIADNQYRNQLFEVLKCNTISMSDFTNLKYNKESILSLFKKYYSCSGNEGKTYENKNIRKAKINISGVASVNNSRFGVTYPTGSSEPSNSIGFGIGAEVAVVLPSEKLEFFLMPEYEMISASSRFIRGNGSVQENSTFEINDGFINLHVGSRYNFLLNTNNKIFLQVSFGFSMPMNDIDYHETYPNAGVDPRLIILKTSTANFFSAGAGYTYKNKASIALTYTFNRDFLTQNLTSTDFSRIGLSLRYKII